ncbi:hypothetical protein [Pseudoalteromonas obscura]|uniref:Uncharacterized protein n=1 Tax=Pseudoalteromonas obscura TaxID=3048491 RepID=A0ABT7EGQ7_9GAMM|nr:hypothetical protein [Pseudoalteromonas sp. P94(2023)]MDK2594229.1 hypothetical protein [Pseudoalteromonas sp. P94(2023)]
MAQSFPPEYILDVDSEGTVVEYTPTSRAIIKVLDDSNVDNLVRMMEAKFNGAS